MVNSAIFWYNTYSTLLLGIRITYEPKIIVFFLTFYTQHQNSTFNHLDIAEFFEACEDPDLEGFATRLHFFTKASILFPITICYRSDISNTRKNSMFLGNGHFE